jgi:transposase
VVEFILDLARRFEELTASSARLEERVRRLEEQARKDSRNSSQPPSADPPKTRQQRRAEARAKAKDLSAKGGERKAGGQPGHRGSGRESSPEDQVDEIVDHYPERCGGCGHEFGAAERSPGGRFGRHQVAELPPISVVVTEHRTLPGLPRQDDGGAARRDRRLGVRAQAAGRGRDADRQKPRLAARHGRARR